MSGGELRAQDPALWAQRPTATHAYIEPTAIEWMLVCFAYDKQLFDEARNLVQPYHFTAREAPLRLVYEAMCISQDQYSGITYHTLSQTAEQLLNQSQETVFTDSQLHTIFRQDAQGLIWQICAPTGVEMNATNTNYARELLRKFAQERTVVSPLRTLLNPSVNDGVPENLSGFLDVINQQQAKLSTFNRVPEVDVAPAIGSPLIQSSVFRKTGVTFIDNILQGQRDGDCNGLIGPTGGGKTTLAIHMAVAAAKQCWAEAQLSGEPPGVSVFVSAEEAAIKLRPRIWSAFFNIPREKLETMENWDQLTTPGHLASYELRMQVEQEIKLSELERYQLYSPQLSQCFKLHDLSGSDEFPDAGNGYVDEIVSNLSRCLQPIRSVFIDYAGILCERYLAAIGTDDPSRYRYLLKTFGDRCRKEIAERFGCTVWVLHQVKGEAGTAKPSKLIHHSEAGESKDFATNMAVCGCLGVADPATGCRRLNFSKVRYRPNESITPPTLRIDDRFAVMRDVTSQFSLAEGGQQFITAADQQQVHAVDTSHRTAQQGPAGMSPADSSQWTDL